MTADPNETSVFIQARMSSARFPGKVLAPFRGRPLLHHVIARARVALASAPVFVLTSIDPSDDPLAAYVDSLRSEMGVTVFRGDLDDVHSRFAGCLERYPARSFVRICADSPLQNENLLKLAVDTFGKARPDLLTTTFPRTFPKGQNIEVVSSQVFLKTVGLALDPGQREHVTSYFYQHADQFRILPLKCESGDFSGINLCVDTLADLLRLEALADVEIARFTSALQVTA